MPQQPIEQPLYILPQVKKRILIPKVFAFFFLGIAFYLGILLNISLLELTASTETNIKLISLITLIVIILLGILINIKKSKQKYFFYHDKIILKNNQILLSKITDIKTKKNFLDKFFKTYSLTLNQKFLIKNISQKIQLQDYIQKLVAYSKSQITY